MPDGAQGASQRGDGPGLDPASAILISLKSWFRGDGSPGPSGEGLLTPRPLGVTSQWWGHSYWSGDQASPVTHKMKKKKGFS